MIVFILVFLLFGGPVFAASVPEPAVSALERTADDFGLYDQNGNFHQLTYYSDQKAIVLFSYGIGCPIARKSVGTLHDLQKEFAPLGVTFFFIDANDQDSREALKTEAKDYGIDFPILADGTGLVAKSLKMQRTAEAIVIDPKSWKIIYQGPVDDRFGYEASQPDAQHHYLKDALAAFLEHKPVNIAFASVKGCLLPGHASKKVSYTREIAPLLKQKCVFCHTTGGVAPWSMDNYEKITRWGPMIREVVRTRRMPPWHADPLYGKFRNDLSLTDAEAEKIVEWVEDGMVKGSGKDPLVNKDKKRSSEWMLGEPDIVFTFNAKQELPPTGIDIYNIVEAGKVAEKDMWITALEIKPGNARVVHHCNIVIQNDLVKKLADQSPSPDGKKWFMESGLTGESGQMIGGFSPGMGAVELPNDTGIFIPKGSHIIFKMHYITTGKPEEDISKVGFYFAKKQPHRALSVQTLANRDIHVPAGEKNYTLKATYTFSEDVLLTALQPHMHFHGKSMRFTAIYPDGTSEILLSVPNYRFTWQRQYVLKEPKKIPKGTQIILDGNYDNSAQNPTNPDPKQDVLYGPGSGQEMFTGIMYFIKEET